MTDRPFPITMEEVTDPEELAKARAQRERFDRNFAWFREHAAELFARACGKCICIAGEELFIADTPEEVMALAQAAHPEDDGSFMQYIPREKLGYWNMYQLVEKLSYTELAALTELKALLAQQYSVQDIRLFGSKARGTGHVESDIDLFIVVPNLDWERAKTIYTLCFDLSLR